CVATLVGGYW
nr:immunoglobulin heavy chain junction region [Mus musculus]